MKYKFGDKIIVGKSKYKAVIVRVYEAYLDIVYNLKVDPYIIRIRIEDVKRKLTK